ncbi:MAG: right-handed parallel beta-helix repeat-containing protein [Chloracidobacterium sp.]|nr:right-handed parallel beta-helix repeat-containing protein [Chloracidobacterium sp.]
MMVLSGLTTGTLYHYRVMSNDEAGNLATSGDLTFTTNSGAPPPTGDTFYVSPTGSDSNPGTETQPFLTIQRAADVVNPGNTVIVEDGVYTYSGSNQCDKTIVCLTRGGAPGQLVTFKSRNKWGARLDGQNGVAVDGFSFGGADYVRIQDFEIYGMANAASGGASGIDVFNSGVFSELIGNHIHDNGHVCTDTAQGQNGVYIEQSNVLVDGNLIHDIGRLVPGQQGCQPGNDFYQNHDHGIYHSGGDDVTIRNNIIYNIKGGWSVQAYPNSRARMNILNNTFAFTNQYQGKYGAIIIYDSMTVSDSNISNNVFYMVNTAGIYAGGTGGPNFSNVMVNNNIVSNGTILTSDNNVGSGLTFSNNRENTDPGLVNPTAYDFHLRADSLAIDSGATVPVPTDFEGRVRPQGGGYDIGAYEYSSSGISSLPNIWATSVAFDLIRVSCNSEPFRQRGQTPYLALARSGHLAP